MCVGLCAPLSATAVNQEEYLPGNIGILTTDDGRQYEIKGELVSVAQPFSNDSNNTSSATYCYTIPARISDSSTTVPGVDGGNESKVYLTIYYQTKGTPTLYLLTGVSGYWELTSATGKTRVESATLDYGCSSLAPQIITQRKMGVSVSNHFSIRTGFSKYIVSEGGGVMGANLHLNYVMGNSRRWSFTLQNNLFNTAIR